MQNDLKPKCQWRSRGSPKGEHVLAFTRQLARGMARGMPLLGCLRHTLEHEYSPVMRDLERDCIESIVGDQTFSEALARHPEAFDAFYVTMVKAGELHGMLDTVLEELAVTLQKAQDTNRRLFGATVYPIAIVGLLALGLAYWGLRVWFASHTAGTIPIVAGVGLLLMVGLLLARRTRFGRRVVDGWKLRVPRFGALIGRAIMARSIRTFGCLLSHQWPVLEAISVAQQTSGNILISEALGTWGECVKEGETMTAILEPLGFGPSPCCARVELPDDPESFANQLRRFADDLEQEVHASLTTLQTVVGPILAVVLMVLVASLVVMASNL